MIQLRYLINAELDKATNTKQDNGTILSTFTKINDYQIQLQELTDEISASIYGADINRIYRVVSPKHALESFLATKVNNLSDNVSLYYLLINNVRYKIKVVRFNWIDIELI